MQQSMPEMMPFQEEALQAMDVVPKRTSMGQVNFPNLETRAEKLARKEKARGMFYRSRSQPLVLANISKNHMDYGLSPAEHLRAKLERAENNS